MGNTSMTKPPDEDDDDDLDMPFKGMKYTLPGPRPVHTRSAVPEYSAYANEQAVLKQAALDTFAAIARGDLAERDRIHNQVRPLLEAPVK